MHGVVVALGKLRRIIAQDGVRAGARIVWINLVALANNTLSNALDLIFNVDTRGVTPIAELDIRAETREQGFWYEATPWFSLSAILRRLDCNLDSYVFIDFGSGKGRTLIEAARFPFRAVIGVEFSPELCAVAEANLRRVRFFRRRAREVGVKCQDAAVFDLPRAPCILYFYNPFNADVMRMIAERIKASFKANPRDIVAVFYAENENDIFHSLSFMSEIDRGRIADAVTGRWREYSILRSRLLATPDNGGEVRLTGSSGRL